MALEATSVVAKNASAGASREKHPALLLPLVHAQTRLERAEFRQDRPAPGASARPEVDARGGDAALGVERR